MDEATLNQIAAADPLRSTWLTANAGSGKTHPREHDDLIEAETWDGFVRLLRSYVTGEAGFTAMRAPQSTAYAGDYDHLARYGEWSLTDAAVPRKVGDHHG